MNLTSESLDDVLARGQSERVDHDKHPLGRDRPITTPTSRRLEDLIPETQAPIGRAAPTPASLMPEDLLGAAALSPRQPYSEGENAGHRTLDQVALAECEAHRDPVTGRYTKGAPGRPRGATDRRPRPPRGWKGRLALAYARRTGFDLNT